MKEATLIALAALNNANKGTTTMKITLRPAQTAAIKKIIATSCVQITGLGKLNGKYYVEEVGYSVSDGCKTTLNLRKVETRITKAKSVSSNTSKSKSSGSKSTTSTAKKPSSSSGSSSKQTIKKGSQYKLSSTKKGYYTAAEAKAGRATGGHPTGTVKAGTYYIFNISQGMLNLSKSKSSPGSWIKP